MLFNRILTVVVIVPVLIATLLSPWTWIFRLLVTSCLVTALWEFFSIAGLVKRERVFSVGLGLFHVLYLLFCPAFYPFGGRPIFWESILLLMILFLFYSFVSRTGVEKSAERIGLTLFGIIWIGTAGSFIARIRELPDGLFWIFALLTMTWLNDTAAYFVGHRWGRRRLAPRLSPGKTVEGFLGGFIGSLAGLLFCRAVFDNPLSVSQGLLLVLLVGIFGPLGDLSESLIKRSFGVKDSGNIIPGHGGMLDRIDALLFTAPVVYYFAHTFAS